MPALDRRAGLQLGDQRAAVNDLASQGRVAAGVNMAQAAAQDGDGAATLSLKGAAMGRGVDAQGEPADDRDPPVGQPQSQPPRRLAGWRGGLPGANHRDSLLVLPKSALHKKHGGRVCRLPQVDGVGAPDVRRPLARDRLPTVPVGRGRVTAHYTQGFPGDSPTGTLRLDIATVLDSAEVLEVIDGDTIRVRLGDEAHLVRYIGIDAPETGEGYRPYEWLGPEATDVNASLVAGGRVWLVGDVSDEDAYGRLLRYVWADGLLVNAEMVRRGYAEAKAYPPDTAYSALLEDAEQEARAAKRGLWGARPTGTPPPRGAESACPYVGNRRSMKFHRGDCASVAQIAPANRVCLASREEALAAGYTPCGSCRP